MVNLSLEYGFLIPIFSLLAFVVLILAGRRMGRYASWISIGAIAASFIFSLFAFISVVNGESINKGYEWLRLGDFSLKFGWLIDPLTSMMLLIVTFIGMLIQIYSVGYMHNDHKFSRFFAYMSLFTFSMLGLVLSNNYVQIYMFWELVGLCSYLLISFWFEKTPAANAGKKAFITTRIGDVGLFLGILTLFFSIGTLDFGEVSERLRTLHGNSGMLTIAAVLIFCGAIGKSAQFPLHVWLPDAMEGPTPVSALIHAATMVAAGVYLVARSFVIFHAYPGSLVVVAYIGTITAFMAATIALVANDIKRVLAYSTISQLGYMMMGLGVGGYTAGSFHLMTHAFFKALLFLGAGSVIHGTHTQDIRDMGGLGRKMKVTATTFILASLSIAGFPGFSGFWSKDEILLEAFRSDIPGHLFIFCVGTFTAFLTSFYMFRLCFLTFFGKQRGNIHPHESPKVMTVPLVILSVFAVFVGLSGSPIMGNWFSHFIHFEGSHVEPSAFVMGLSIFVSLAGIFMAWAMYVKRVKPLEEFIARRLSLVYNILLNKYWFDELYDFAIIKPFMRLTHVSFRFDQKIIDGFVNRTAYTMVILSRIKRWIDVYIVDGMVNGVAWVTKTSGEVLKLTQTGLVQNYALVIFMGVVVIVILKLM